MDRIAHTALSAMRGAMARQQATANNLANAGVSGFRSELTASQTVYFGTNGVIAGARTSEEVVSADMRPGAITQTGRPLDIAMNADALLTVQAENGDEAYTRRGDLQVTDSGLLTTGDGRPVQGEGGPITLPPFDSIRIAPDGAIWIVPQGGDADNPTQVDRLKLVSPQGSDVVKGVDGLFRVRNGGALPADPVASITGGSLEQSNVNVTRTLIDMIEASRAWDTQLGLISSAKDMDTSATDLMRLPG